MTDDDLTPELRDAVDRDGRRYFAQGSPLSFHDVLTEWARRVQRAEADLSIFCRYLDPMNPGQVECCGRCGAPCEVVRPGKTQCHACDWWEYAPESPLTGARREAEEWRDRYQVRTREGVQPFWWEGAEGAGPQPKEDVMDSYYNWVPGRGEPKRPHPTRAEAVVACEAQRLANKERREVTVLRVEDRIAPSGPAVAPPPAATPFGYGSGQNLTVTREEFEAMRQVVIDLDYEIHSEVEDRFAALRNLATALAEAYSGPSEPWPNFEDRIRALAQRVKAK